MDHDDFEAMPYENALLDATEVGDVGKVNAVFKELKALGDEDCKRITGAIEKSFVEDTKEMAKEAKEFLKSAPEGSLVSFGVEGGVVDEPKSVKAGFHVLEQIAQIRGKAADPFTKAFAQAAKKVPEDERNSMAQLITTAVKAYDKTFPAKGPKAPGA